MSYGPSEQNLMGDLPRLVALAGISSTAALGRSSWVAESILVRLYSVEAVSSTRLCRLCREIEVLPHISLSPFSSATWSESSAIQMTATSMILVL